MRFVGNIAVVFDGSVQSLHGAVERTAAFLVRCDRSIQLPALVQRLIEEILIFLVFLVLFGPWVCSLAAFDLSRAHVHTNASAHARNTSERAFCMD